MRSVDQQWKKAETNEDNDRYLIKMITPSHVSELDHLSLADTSDPRPGCQNGSLGGVSAGTSLVPDFRHNQYWPPNFDKAVFRTKVCRMEMTVVSD
ncbi:hypothetical protein [Novipirellula artificiosorum]|uniref:hypothetical protein n=1 Tax=Novipirellula artificiosorum TaxID=2528016 RepID=UPI0011B49930|nr:hypothetical protein [Novipirellula artificiosorum]